MNKQKDRLVELLKETRCERSCDGFKNIEVCNGCTAYERYAESADRILADGWMRPPCKVGEHVWYFDIESRELVEGKVDGYLWFRSCGFALNVIWEKPIMGHFSYCRKEMPFSEVGKTVFLSREEAEAKLKEGVQG